ncbi:hypothetical protein LINGRAHAP2_LOCUS29132 [Linum grandiflorum]
MQSHLRTITSNRKTKARTLEEESGILKLVHPGRHVEIHRKPISASQVMIQNPRHSVAPPQVFHKPWLVLRPEALLHPGQVSSSDDVNGSFEEEIRLSSSFYHRHRNSQFCTGNCYGGFEREDVSLNPQVDKLKSCLRYPDSPRRLLDLRVNFAFACSNS